MHAGSEVVNGISGAPLAASGPTRIRLAHADDLDAIVELAKQAGPGMTTLKPDRVALEKRLHCAAETLEGRAPLHVQDYVFVLEDLVNARVVGLSAIKAAVGIDQPFYSFRLGTLVHASKQISIVKKFQTMYLSNDMTGSAELCSLFLLPEYRTRTNGRLLSKCRLLFLALFSERFPSHIMAEMRGYQRGDGAVPFWDGFAKQFFEIDFGTADALTSDGNKTFIAELMPRYPIYTALLPLEVRDAMGVVHPQTVPARRLLEQEGLRYNGYIDIFDGGPQLTASIGELRATRDTTRMLCRVDDRRGQKLRLIANPDLRRFSAIVSDGAFSDGQLRLYPSEVAALGIECGESAAALDLNSEPSLKSESQPTVIRENAAT